MMKKASAWLTVGVLFLAVGRGRAQEIVAGPDRVQALAESCLNSAPGCQPSCHEHRSCLRWLTYCPKGSCLCDCCHKCKPCCDPPIYLFFLCQGCGGRDYCAACNGNFTCPSCACAGQTAHRIYHCHPDKNCNGESCGH
jgi:hypothetical protein